MAVPAGRATGVDLATPPSVHVVSNGCPENRIDGARAIELLKRNGWATTAEASQADLILFVSCGLTQHNEDLSMGIVDHLQAAKKPGAELLVCGCLDKINPRRLRTVYGGPLFGADEFEHLDHLLDLQVPSARVQANYVIPYTVPLSGRARALASIKSVGLAFGASAILDRLYARRLNAQTTEFRGGAYCIKVSTGCSYQCAYCAVRIARGAVRSKPLDRVVGEFDQGYAEGHRTFALIGTDLGSYGRDLDTDLVELLVRLLARAGDAVLRLRNVHPRLLISRTSDMERLVRSGRVAYIASAVQSGSDAVLRRMRRGYTAGEYAGAIQRLRRANPALEVRTQMMVGFPGETDEDHAQTMALIRGVPFDYAEVYMFEPRPGTEAASLPNPVPRAVAARRRNQAFATALWHSLRWRQRRGAVAEERRARVWARADGPAEGVPPQGG